MTIDHREVKSKLRINLKINEDNSCDVTIKDVSINYKNQLLNLIKANPVDLYLEDLEDIIFQAKIRTQIKNTNLIKPVDSLEDKVVSTIKKKETFKPNFLNQIDNSNNIVCKSKNIPGISLLYPKLSETSEFLSPIKTRKLKPIYDCEKEQKLDIVNYINEDCENNEAQAYSKYLSDLESIFSVKDNNITNDDLDSFDFIKKQNNDSISISKNENFNVINASSDEFACFSDYDLEDNNNNKILPVNSSEDEIDYPDEEDYQFDSFEEDSFGEIYYPEDDYQLDSFEEESINDSDYFEEKYWKNNDYNKNTKSSEVFETGVFPKDIIFSKNDVVSEDDLVSEDDNINNIIEKDIKIESISYDEDEDEDENEDEDEDENGNEDEDEDDEDEEKENINYEHPNRIVKEVKDTTDLEEFNIIEVSKIPEKLNISIKKNSKEIEIKNKLDTINEENIVSSNESEDLENTAVKTRDNNEYSIKPINENMKIWDEDEDKDKDDSAIESYVNKIKNDVQEEEEKNNCVIC